jgi:hypothetical protein
MSGQHTFYVRFLTTGSDIESIHNFLISTNIPPISFDASLTLQGTGSFYCAGNLIITPETNVQVVNIDTAKFSRIYSVSGSLVAVTTFIPYGAVNDVVPP